MDVIHYNKGVEPHSHSDMQQCKDICHDVGNCDEPCNVPSDNPGQIYIVGTGVKSIAHCTLESLTEIKRSNHVFFLVDDTVTELFLKDLRPDGIDLNMFLHQCGNDTMSMCVEIVERCLHHARKGSSVCVVLHGDTNMAVVTSQRLRRLAKCEGIGVRIVSAPGLIDSLIASMEIDVSITNITLNAVEFLLSYIELDTCSNVILRHLGDVTNACQNGSVDGLQCFHLLIDKLMNTYAGSHEVVLYQGTQYCLVHPPYEHVTLAVLSHITEEQLENISNAASLYIPCTVEPPVDITVGMALGCLQDGTPAHATVKRELGLRHDDYGATETRALQDLQNLVVPDGYIWPEDNDLSDLLCEMSLNSNLLHYWETTGAPMLEDDVQNAALQSHNESAIEDAIKFHQQHPKNEIPARSSLNSGHVPWKKLNDNGRTEQIPRTIGQMIVLYENDTDDACYDSSSSSDDSDIIREAYTECPREEEPTPPGAARI